MKSLIVAILSLASFILPATDFARAQVPPALKVVGNQLQDPSGKVVRLLGVHISGTEYACIAVRKDGVRGYGFGDGGVLRQDPDPVTHKYVNEQALTNLLSWNVNAVRVPLNQDCWLAPPEKTGAIPPPNPMYIGKPYRDAIIAYVQALNAKGLYVILDLHWSAPGKQVADVKDFMADANYSLDFWKSVATTFNDTDYPAVLFDLFNEPAFGLGGEGKDGQWVNQVWTATTADWLCWLNGGCSLLWQQNSNSNNAPTTEPTCDEVVDKVVDRKNCQYKSVGMKDLLNAVRGAGAHKPVLVGGLAYTQDITQWLTYAAMLTDQQNTNQIVASYHPYCLYKVFSVEGCQKSLKNQQDNWWPLIKTIAASFPVVLGEIGEYDCSTTFLDAYLPFADQNGMSYLGFTYNTVDCSNPDNGGPALIKDNAGKPTPFGIGLKSHLATLVPTVTALSQNSGPSAGGTPVTVSGTNFTGARAVNFGSTAVTSFTVNSDTSISVTSPPGNGAQDVTVTTYLATSAKNKNDQFTFVWSSTALLAPSPLAPTVTSVTLSSGLFAAGPTAGGTVVEIDGFNLSEATAVYFGANAAASYSVVTAGVLTATSPAGSGQGPVDITVTTPFGTSQTSAADQFAYVDAPGLTAPISPALGPAAGGTFVTLTGTGFTYATAVNFGANPASSFQISSDTSITAIAPPGSGLTLGQAAVTVVNPAGTSSPFLNALYTYTCDSHDFNGDGNSDILWRDASGNTVPWLMNGPQVLGSASYGVVPSSWQIVGQRDFTGLGRCGLLWRDSSGNTTIWLLTGLLVQEAASLGNVPTSWAVVGTSDFNGDGYGDILWKDSSGDVAIWLMNGLSVAQAAGVGNVGTAWSVAGTGDFNGDGNSDILWRDSSGNLAVWLMSGATVLQAASLGAVPGNWQIMGTGDFNGDGVTDILWQDSNTGTVAFWLLNSSAQILQTAALGAVATPWSITLTGDYNGDGYSDILWRNITTGDVAIWFLGPSLVNRGGAEVSSAAFVGNVPTTWTIQNANAE
jgi:hypothetical protein